MRRGVFIVAMCVVASAVAPRVRGAEEKKAPADTEAVAKIVGTYFENAASADKVEKNADLFVKPDSVVVGVARGGGAEKVWTKKVADLLPEQRKELQGLGRDVPYKVESMKVDLLDRSLAVARVSYRNEFVKCRGVFTLTSEAGSWKIASLVFETRLPDSE